MDTFNPPVPPTDESSASFSAQTFQAELGEEHENVASAGLNSIRGSYQLVWNLLTRAEREEIEDFFTARLGAISFLYTFPGELTARKFRCKTWSRDYEGGLYTVRAELREVFDLE